ncbi:cocaine- and amphetamine-regulated transcript protein-like [Micropterus dolomieu]|uniref:cocaine- and amphetamine-regulated transcript protein-like n=1 Tax=Micropterus dolomieu TaxID=147949 RepID=UPI001E8DC4CC|nr:cocaine- and amphetamine-regulated transcript protein-like [Micropterus dolomieu]
MVSGRILLLSASCWLLVVVGSSEELKQERSAEDEEKVLIEALQEVLEKLKNKEPPSSEKKLGWVPACDAGQQCAVRKGSRIGRLCACPGGTACDFSVLKFQTSAAHKDFIGTFTFVKCCSLGLGTGGSPVQVQHCQRSP